MPAARQRSLNTPLFCTLLQQGDNEYRLPKHIRVEPPKYNVRMLATPRLAVQNNAVVRKVTFLKSPAPHGSPIEQVLVRTSDNRNVLRLLP